MLSCKNLIENSIKRCSNLMKKRIQLRTSSSHSPNDQSLKDIYAKDLMRTITHPRLSYATSLSEFPIFSQVVGDLLVRNDELKNKLVYGFPHQRVNLTFDELYDRVETAAKNLIDLGFRKGERIAFVLPNTHELAVLFLAASKIGLISILLNPAYQHSELEYMLKKTATKGLVIYDSFKTLKHLEIMRKICPELGSSRPGELSSKSMPDLKHVFVANSPFEKEKKTYQGTWSLSKLSETKSTSSNFNMPTVDMDDPCLILFTSGTTGNPKGATITHAGLLNSLYLSTVVVGANSKDNMNIVCNPIPLFHIFGLSTGLVLPLMFGVTKVFPLYFPETVSTIKAIEAYGCETLRGTPTQFFDLINHPERKKHNLKSLKSIIVGGATIPTDLLMMFKKEMDIENVIVGYGMTETSLCHSVTTFHDGHHRPFKQAFESVGRPLPFSETKIVDSSSGNTVPLNTDGELYIRSIYTIKKYWDEPEKTADTIDKNGWLKTGDVFSMDSDGFLFFKSRSKELIIRGGANIYPAEIEAFFRTHPNILDAQAFGVPDQRLGEEVCAWVKLKPNTVLTENEIRNFCKGKISHFKIPRYIKFVNSFPINANAKVLKNKMRETIIQELKLEQN